MSDDEFNEGAPVDEPMCDEGDICGDGSVIKTVVIAGQGDTRPRIGAKVFVHYTGTLENGNKFDSSRDRNQPFDFKLGTGVIQGWNDAVKTMKKGERSSFIIKSHKAYGEAGSPPTIPKNATLVFDIELLEWTAAEDVSEKHDGSVMKETLRDAPRTEYKRPNDLSTVVVHYSLVTEDGVVLRDTRLNGAPPVTAIVDCELIPAVIATSVKTMKKGESAKFCLAPAVTAISAAELGIPVGMVLVATVELLDFSSRAEAYDLSFEDKLAALEELRLLGNSLFGQGDYARARRRYDMALKYFEYDSSVEESKKKTVKERKLPVFLNAAACSLKLNDYQDTLKNCNKALEIDSRNVKGLFRRASTRMALKEWPESKKDLQQVLALDPKNADALKTLATVNAIIQEQNKKDRALYANMFERMAPAPPKDTTGGTSA